MDSRLIFLHWIWTEHGGRGGRVHLDRGRRRQQPLGRLEQHRQHDDLSPVLQRSRRSIHTFPTIRNIMCVADLFVSIIAKRIAGNGCNRKRNIYAFLFCLFEDLECKRHKLVFMLNLLRFAPSELFNEATMTLLMPSVRSLGPLTMEQVEGAIPSPLPLGQSLMVVWPQLTGMIASTVICFGLSYLSFMRKEVRSR